MRGAAPGPFTGCFREKRFHRILFGITDGAFQVCFVADERIEIILLPKCAASSKPFVGFARGSALPDIHQFKKRHIPDIYDHVNVIWHYYPREKPIVVSISLYENLLKSLCNISSPEPAFPVA